MHWPVTVAIASRPQDGQAGLEASLSRLLRASSDIHRGIGPARRALDL